MINVEYLDIIDSLASPAATFLAIDSADSGNNTNWTFATSVDGEASITALSSITVNLSSNIWTDVSVGNNTWLRQG